MMGIHRLAILCAGLLGGIVGAAATPVEEAPLEARPAPAPEPKAETGPEAKGETAPEAKREPEPEPEGKPGTESLTETVPEAEAEPKGPDWSFSASLYTYVVPHDPAYVQPTVTADHRWLHLEGRYNYEDMETGSVWAGYNFTLGEKLSLEITPMFGGVFGRTMGIAPGFRGSLSWWWLELYGEGEWVFDLEERSDSFLYCWSELTVSPWDWLRAGLVTQRTRAYESDLAVQRGFLVGFSLLHVDVSTYVFNPDEDPPTFVISVGVEF